ncbi:ABC transporter ATP-binding protein [Paenibacillus sp. y28]|uniref:ABC transporter ATP-binding protein n=1 Tax=Paenibacillus sp. y28 TaxID=3129110 RepID=UPI00301A00D5
MRFEHISIAYGSRQIFKEFSFALDPGQITCVMGASGIGKTTMLRMAAGLERPSSGIIRRPGAARTGMVFQEPRLLPGKTVLDNILWVLDQPKRREAQQQARALLDAAGLAQAAGDYPQQLSGGMRQRAAVVRAFAAEPDLLVMDEPFQSLDMASRQEMYALLLRLHHSGRPTVLLVTHDLEEALTLGTRIVVLGGSPVEVVLDVAAAREEGGPYFSEADRLRLAQMTRGTATF